MSYTARSLVVLFVLRAGLGFSLVPTRENRSAKTTALNMLSGRMPFPTTSREGPASSTFFDVEEEGREGEVCFLTDSDQVVMTKPEVDQERALSYTIHSLIRLIPIINPIEAYFTYERLAQQVDVIVELLSDNQWVAVDGGAYQVKKIIAPAINGVIVPAISILFATLIVNTVNSLRQHLLDI